MINAEVDDSDKGDEVVTDASKADAEKTSEVMDDPKKTELPLTSSSLSVSLGFGDQFLKLSSYSSLVSTVKDTTDTKINSLLEVKIQSEVPHTQSSSVLSVHVSMISKPIVPTPVQESLSKAIITTLPPLYVSTTPYKSALYQTMHANKSFNQNLDNHRMYHALMEALIEDENAMNKGVDDTVQDHKMKHDDDEHDDDEDPPARPNHGKNTKKRRTKESESSKKPSFTKETLKGKASSKGSKAGKSASVKEPDEEPIAEVVMNDADDNVVHDDDQPQDTSEPNMAKTLNPEWYDKDALKGIKHWAERRKLWHKSQVNKFSKHNVYSIKKILGVKSVSVKKLHRYGHLEEIVMKRVDRQLYKFKEGDFVDLHMNDIKYMLILAVQHKLFHLTDSDIFDFIVALCMFTRSLVIKKRVKDLQLGVESYQKKLNITPPQQTVPEINFFKEPYTSSHKPPGVIYEDLEMERRKWTTIDKKRSALMVELIDKQIRERRIIWNLERLVGAWELEMDYELTTRTT
nr:hypothetical protein [Tanacetum cinerariifolium]